MGKQPAHRGRLPLSSEVRGTRPEGSEDPDSLIARARWTDRASPDPQLDAATLSQIAGTVLADRITGEPLPVGEPPVGAQKTSAGVSALQTVSSLKLKYAGSVTHSMAIGSELILGNALGFVPALAEQGRDPAIWTTSTGPEDSWTYASSGGTWQSNAWGGVVKLEVTFQIRSGSQGLVLSTRWEYVSSDPDVPPFVWAPVDVGPKEEFDATDQPQPMHILLDNVGEAEIPIGHPQRLWVRREAGGPAGAVDVTIEYVRVTVSLSQLRLPP